MEQSEQAQRAFLNELLAHGLLIDCGVPGVYGRSAVFEGVNGASKRSEKAIAYPSPRVRAPSRRTSQSAIRRPSPVFS